ncbi:MAG: NAD(P)/FAD-dependent oxidoreductase [Candidatus Omnitrophota bacterium]|jgi:L-2-hydroxyglutarate oxidase LhgO
MEKFNITIIGAGVIGLAIARELSKRSNAVLVVEKNINFGMETSSRNSEVIHAGIYYPAGSLKAATCIEGNKLLYEICRDNRIPFKKLGKLIVALDKIEAAELNKLYENALSNGVEDIEMLSKESISKLEPNINAYAAIYSKSTGIIDSHSLMAYYLDQAKGRGVLVSFKTKVEEIEKLSVGYKVTVIDSDGGRVSFISERVINAAGLESDNIARLSGIDVEKQGYILDYWKGQYFKVNHSKGSLIGRLVYPLPHKALTGLGIHATINLAGTVRLGPDHKHIQRDKPDYNVDLSDAASFLSAAEKYMPFLKIDDISPDTAGIRPKLRSLNGGFRDFIIREESKSGFAGFVNLIGIESPGLTASPAIARYINKLFS